MLMRIQRPLPVTAGISVVEEVTGLSKSTIRRLTKTDPDFPRPFRLKEGGHLQWPTVEVLQFLERRAGRPLIAA
jgi:predicted DNA-binding transcriptional regulator AlpA